MAGKITNWLQHAWNAFRSDEEKPYVYQPETGVGYGIRPDRTQNYHADARGVNLNFDVMSKTVANFRMNASIDEDWKEQIEKDFEERNK